MPIGLFAVDYGPRSIILALAKYSNFKICDAEGIETNNFEAIIVGTSGSRNGKGLESNIRFKAVQSKIPLIIIEDYPGNFDYIQDGQPDLLIVEHSVVKELHHTQLGKLCPTIAVFPNPRYDELRKSGGIIREKLENYWNNHNKEYSILWAGQPETEDTLQTLTRIMPVIREMGLRLLFKAHPRDPGYKSGTYTNIADYLGQLWEDVTPYDLLKCTDMYAPRAILTQYSSLAIEAGFCGIPSANVLFPDIGGKRLMVDKGFIVPPWCQSGAAVVIQNKSEVREKLEVLIFNNELRQTINKQFLSWFGSISSANKVVKEIKRLISENPNKLKQHNTTNIE